MLVKKTCSGTSTLACLLLLCAAFLQLSSAPVLGQGSRAQLRRVSHVVDGDTIVLENGEKVRLIGVDTPETRHPQRPVERFGKEASAFTKSLLEGQRVLIETDPANSHLGHKDKYGRTLAYVWTEQGKLVNAEIIRQGYGHALTRYPFKYLPEFRDLERHAREQGNGLWSVYAENLPGPRDAGSGAVRRSVNRTRAAHSPQPQPAPNRTPESATSDVEARENRSPDGSQYDAPVIDRTPAGQPIYQGPCGGRYHITSGGRKSYHPRPGS
ncbi:MAG TPA: thermonuclease family protein [candidate division Zixibacteria bacterium]|nr:thermonuclease family protein [candidate division Zixibacteria bacterium]